MREERIAVVGLGYVGLPLAVAFANDNLHRRPAVVLPAVIGYDINEARIDALRRCADATGEVSNFDLQGLLAGPAAISFTNNPTQLHDATCIIITVPTPVTDAKVPDLTLIERAAEMVGRHLARGTVVVLESTVYPGVTEGVVVPIIERASSMRCGRDWFVGYSPERINPGDRAHRINVVVKVVAGMDATTTERLAAIYGTICTVHRAPSIKVAEAAKVFENVQRDLGIAAVNELARICHLLRISVFDVLDAARTKWNFNDYRPGLVGGHCIGVDPHYLAHCAQEHGYHPEVILSGRRVNDAMPIHVADRVLKGLIATSRPIRGARVLVLGLTFKPNVPDTRNSKVRDVIARLREFRMEVLAHDPLLPIGALDDGFHIENLEKLDHADIVDGIVIATLHDEFSAISLEQFQRILRIPNVVFDVSGHFAKTLRGAPGITYDTF